MACSIQVDMIPPNIRSTVVAPYRINNDSGAFCNTTQTPAVDQEMTSGIVKTG